MPRDGQSGNLRNMPVDALEKKILAQLEALISLLNPQPNFGAFLEEDLLPVDKYTMLQAARYVAERLMLEPSTEGARLLMHEDRGKTQAFFSVAKVAHPVLKKVLLDSPAFAGPHPAPFYEVALWIHGISEI